MLVSRTYRYRPRYLELSRPVVLRTGSLRHGYMYLLQTALGFEISQQVGLIPPGILVTALSTKRTALNSVRGSTQSLLRNYLKWKMMSEAGWPVETWVIWASTVDGRQTPSKYIPTCRYIHIPVCSTATYIVYL